jgi:MFS family permease
MTLPQIGLIASMTLTGSVIGGRHAGKIGRKNTLLASLGLGGAPCLISCW